MSTAMLGAPSPARPSETPSRNDSESRLGSCVALAIAIFLVITVRCWTSYITGHEMIYLLGSRRLFDPSFLARDITWSRLGPTSALFDHLIAPLWAIASAFTIVSIGRLLTWALFAWSIALLARTIRLPAWSAIVGFIVWLLWKQRIAECGSPLEGFQLKAFSYPLMFFSLALVLRGRTAWAGALAGLGTAFHLVVGGWGLLAITIAMVLDRRRFSVHQIAAFLLAATPFVAPLVAAVMLSQTVHLTSEVRARMAEIYVRFAMPHCCDYDFVMIPSRWVRAGLVFVLSIIVTATWPERRAAGFLTRFVAILIVFFIGGEIAERLHLYSILELFPAQLGSALPALFLFLLIPAWSVAQRPPRSWARLGAVLAVLGTLWLAYERGAARELIATPYDFFVEIQRRPWPMRMPNETLYSWIRAGTPKNSVFITPFLPDFWPYAERAQVASMRQPPLDHRIIEWKERLEALNGFRAYPTQGFDTNAELDSSESKLSIEELARIRGLYGATHYLVAGERPDLVDHLVHQANGYSVYELSGIAPRAGAALDRDSNEAPISAVRSDASSIRYAARSLTSGRSCFDGGEPAGGASPSGVSAPF